VGLTRSNTVINNTRTPHPSRFGSHFGVQPGGWNENTDTNSNSINEDDETGAEEEEREWGLSKGMELFEVSAKDDFGKVVFAPIPCSTLTWHLPAGIQNLFDHLISAIIVRKDRIEQENEVKKRDSVLLTAVATPAWSAQADEEEAREKAERSAAASWSCC
jgi:hypothetical protein